MVSLGVPMTRTEYLDLSTRLAKDMKDWIHESRDHHGLQADQLVALNQAAEIIDQTTIRVTGLPTDSMERNCSCRIPSDGENVGKKSINVGRSVP